MAELELERRLVEKIKLFLLELGRGFTFIGNQYELEYEGKTSRVDWLILQIATTPSYSHEPLCDKKTEWLQLP